MVRAPAEWRSTLRRAGAPVRLEDRRAIDLLLPALRWRYQTARQRAVKLLERVGPPAVPRLLRTLQGAETATERGGAAEALDLIPDSRSVPRLIRALKDPAMVVRRFAMVALLRLEAMDAIPHVVRLLEDESGGVGMTLCDEIHRAYDQMAVGPVQIGELPEWIRIHGKVAWYVYAGSHRDIGEKGWQTFMRKVRFAKVQPRGPPGDVYVYDPEDHKGSREASMITIPWASMR